jgi:hypothetical protein
VKATTSLRTVPAERSEPRTHDYKHDNHETFHPHIKGRSDTLSFPPPLSGLTVFPAACKISSTLYFITRAPQKRRRTPPNPVLCEEQESSKHPAQFHISTRPGRGIPVFHRNTPLAW